MHRRRPKWKDWDQALLSAIKFCLYMHEDNPLAIYTAKTAVWYSYQKSMIYSSQLVSYLQRVWLSYLLKYVVHTADVRRCSSYRSCVWTSHRAGKRVIRSKVKQVVEGKSIYAFKKFLDSAILQDACNAALMLAVGSGLRRFLMHVSWDISVVNKNGDGIVLK